MSDTENARDELIEEIAGREVIYVRVTFGEEGGWQGDDDVRVVEGTLAEVLPLLNVEYDAGYGIQQLFGFIWYADGTWSERQQYDEGELWAYKRCPPLPPKAQQTGEPE